MWFHMSTKACSPTTMRCGPLLRRRGVRWPSTSGPFSLLRPRLLSNPRTSAASHSGQQSPLALESGNSDRFLRWLELQGFFKGRPSRCRSWITRHQRSGDMAAPGDRLRSKKNRRDRNCRNRATPDVGSSLLSRCPRLSPAQPRRAVGWHFERPPDRTARRALLPQLYLDDRTQQSSWRPRRAGPCRAPLANTDLIRPPVQRFGITRRWCFPWEPRQVSRSSMPPATKRVHRRSQQLWRLRTPRHCLRSGLSSVPQLAQPVTRPGAQAAPSPGPRPPETPTAGTTTSVPYPTTRSCACTRSSSPHEFEAEP
jgi:hypothetical protein